MDVSKDTYLAYWHTTDLAGSTSEVKVGNHSCFDESHNYALCPAIALAVFVCSVTWWVTFVQGGAKTMACLSGSYGKKSVFLTKNNYQIPDIPSKKFMSGFTMRNTVDNGVPPTGLPV